VPFAPYIVLNYLLFEKFFMWWRSKKMGNRW